MTEVLDIDPDLEPEILTDKAETKTLPCRTCRRACVVTRFASPSKTECSVCRGQQASTAATPAFEFNEALETEVLTDREATKEVPCRKCQRRCVVTTFATAEKVECRSCRGEQKAEHKQKVQIAQARTADPQTLENLADALVNPAFRVVPHCPFDPAHFVELKSVVHSDNYGPRRFVGWAKNQPRWDQETGEAVMYQCRDCQVVISYSTQHPLPLLKQNAPKELRGTSQWREHWLGIDIASLQRISQDNHSSGND